jgi:acylphosphatase
MNEMAETNSDDLACVHIWVTGRVQGVGFRAFVQQAGTLFGLTGWVRNVSYDQVETVAEGRRDVVERFAEAVKTGPPAARVDEARVEWETPTRGLKQFGVRY